jgi:hypothetical protein
MAKVMVMERERERVMLKLWRIIDFFAFEVAQVVAVPAPK